MSKLIELKNFDDTRDLARNVLEKLVGNVVLLKGEIGSGKTTFTQLLGSELNITKITSPTYNLILAYDINPPYKDFTTLYHADFYRLKSSEEVEELGIEEILSDKTNLVVIEWPEIYGPYPKNSLVVDFKVESKQGNQIRTADVYEPTH